MALLDWASYDDMAAWTVALLLTVIALGSLAVLGRLPWRTCVLWALVLLAPVAFSDWGPSDVHMERVETGAQP